MSSILDLFRPKPDPVLVEINTRLADIQVKAAQMSALVGGVTGLTQGQGRTEETLAKILSILAVQITGQSDQSTLLTTIERKVTELMSQITEIRDLAVQAFDENSQSLQLAITKIDELKGNATTPEDQQALEDLRVGLQATIDKNNVFQAQVGGTPTPAPGDGETPASTSEDSDGVFASDEEDNK